MQDQKKNIGVLPILNGVQKTTLRSTVNFVSLARGYAVASTGIDMLQTSPHCRLHCGRIVEAGVNKDHSLAPIHSLSPLTPM